ncbi:Phosphoserine phosphatase RsbU [Anaerohalosphaera lusitana]|uniref:Phosphoserine phosphatase RsbU n=1 Tax=Anaerohalosphaera lusitana TaxID=1936003 RepID=A0A1U9NIW0_9BACT|nr:PP2C family protein-serine/threonine phosphatase [Anaerohalosphaera lusitana]AQT67530.1 Phosphoserine phosphatase RsbU [Anaerohalosphaera lusitana]
MSETDLLKALGIQTATSDVVFCGVADPGKELGELLDSGGLSWGCASVDKIVDYLEGDSRPGTIVLDTRGMNVAQREKVGLVIKSLESRGVATIFVNDAIGFSLDEFELATKVRDFDAAELIGRIESNVAYAKAMKGMLARNRKAVVDETAEDRAQQLRMAGQVQRDFLPSRLPHAEHIRWATLFEPADCVSGDIYDVQRLDEQHIGFYLADAVGHSMPAALLTMFLKQAIVMRETKGNDYRIFGPLEVMQHLNKRMTEQQLSGCLFATCCYGLLNMRTLQMSYCRAGHPYPILKRPGCEPVMFEGKGGLLGVFEGGEFSQELVQLAKGDKLFMYSDGAEPLIGEVDEKGQMEMSSEFKDILKLGVEDLVGEFDKLRMRELKSGYEKDDVTVVALEIR